MCREFTDAASLDRPKPQIFQVSLTDLYFGPIADHNGPALGNNTLSCLKKQVLIPAAAFWESGRPQFNPQIYEEVSGV